MIEQSTDAAWEWPEYPTEILGCKLVRTCSACPEQYDVFLEGEEVGYLRLRHGTFRAYYPNWMSDEVVYLANPEGDGVFTPEEREDYLTRAIEALLKRHS